MDLIELFLNCLLLLFEVLVSGIEQQGVLELAQLNFQCFDLLLQIDQQFLDCLVAYRVIIFGQSLDGDFIHHFVDEIFGDFSGLFVGALFVVVDNDGFVGGVSASSGVAIGLRLCFGGVVLGLFGFRPDFFDLIFVSGRLIGLLLDCEQFGHSLLSVILLKIHV